MYFHNLLVAFDQLANTILGGYPDETLSSHACRSHGRSVFWQFMYHAINFIMRDPLHCEKAYVKEIDLPPEYAQSWDDKYK